ncbi:hypothetical protein LXA43DRAFT_1092512 [Ganoderma leucocontextum]|nr:hypothetical protein LXA43DRAFT_1092512 [Ganoderma leucocontextum]
MVQESVSLVPPTLESALLTDISKWESMPDDLKDWHPDSNQQVLDLVHPSLVLKNPTIRKAQEEADLVDDESVNRLERVFSEKHQWLPTDFEVSRHKSSTAARMHQQPSPYRPQGGSQPSLRHPSERPRLVRRDPSVAPHLGRDHWPFIPDPAPFEPPSTQGRVDFSLKGRTLQVIVKLANIVLTPDNSKYAGGSYHVEGMENEHVVATGLYSYACDNITESRLSFRATPVLNPWRMLQSHEQSDHKGTIVGWALGEESPLNQDMDHIPFELADPLKPGFREILYFFLVNPLTNIISASDVLPQQESWWKSNSCSTRLPPSVPSRESSEVAEERRKEYFRADFTLPYHGKEVSEIEWNMCEQMLMASDS